MYKLINNVYNYLDLNNKTTATFDKLLRIDSCGYPETALRKAMLIRGVIYGADSS